MNNSHKLMKRRALIAFYKRLLKRNVVRQNGAAHQRMKELEKTYEQQTRWFGIRYKGIADESTSVVAKKDLN